MQTWQPDRRCIHAERRYCGKSILEQAVRSRVRHGGRKATDADRYSCLEAYLLVPLVGLRCCTKFSS